MVKKQKIVIALSGGVDSSVAAHILKKQGHELIALYMRNWHDNSITKDNECPWVEDTNYAMSVCEQLDIPFHIVDLSKEYKERIIEYMIKEYKNGQTPNPDILCNKEIKFDVFMKYALSLKANYIATGHYCIKTKIGNNYILKQGKDKLKDQSYFLCQINQEQLKRIIFPIGHLTKNQVRKIAVDENLVTAQKKDSQGLCFVGKIKLPIFLQTELKPMTGDIIEIDKNSKLYTLGEDKIVYNKQDGIKIGSHQGAHYFTIGQRKGLQIGGKKKPLFILSTNVKENIIYVGMGRDHPGLFGRLIKIKNKDIHWMQKEYKLKIGDEANYLVRIRHRQKLQKAKLKMSLNFLHIVFENKQRAIAPGQFAAWYKNDSLLGSGVIS